MFGLANGGPYAGIDPFVCAAGKSVVSRGRLLGGPDKSMGEERGG
jgi:hypothetical protein